MNLSLFDLGRGAVDGETDRTSGHATRLEVQERSDSPSGFNSRPRPDSPTDIIRRVQHRYGPFPILRCLTDEERSNPRVDHRSLVAGEYALVEFRDGRVFAEFADGSRLATTPDITLARIDAEIHSGTWREVKP